MMAVIVSTVEVAIVMDIADCVLPAATTVYVHNIPSCCLPVMMIKASM